MTILDILNYPNPRLHKIASNVEKVDNKIKTIIKDMTETMYAAPGIGLSATQVDFHKKIIIIDISEKQNDLLILINPEILERDGIQESEEGCLSVPGIYEKIKRANSIRVKALNIKGEIFELEVDGKLSICIQHEIDHLFGKVFVEYLSSLKKNRIKSKMIKRIKNSK
ncbi:peptide deformylase [Methylophilaceae bacterium]|jgi:peptide deformylase|nr:peptide deformylase [Methylophilaceae bacterium]|tara:strand:+ start:2041 stop:2544 length:504 start_codon:yes stop_codon:yes gene_type:complete